MCKIWSTIIITAWLIQFPWFFQGPKTPQFLIFSPCDLLKKEDCWLLFPLPSIQTGLAHGPAIKLLAGDQRSINLLGFQTKQGSFEILQFNTHSDVSSSSGCCSWLCRHVVGLAGGSTKRNRVLPTFSWFFQPLGAWPAECTPLKLNIDTLQNNHTGPYL